MQQGEAARHAGGTSYVQTVSLEYEARTLLSGAEDAESDSEKEQGSGAEGDSVKPAAYQPGEENAGDVAADSSPAAPGGGGLPGEAEGGTASALDAKPESGKVLYLTFDDGPSLHTPEVLDILKREGVNATFFVLGEHVEQHPDIARRIVEEGHAIGNHTYNHEYEKLYGSFGEFASQIMKTDNAIYEAAEVRTTLVRAPGGTYRNFDKGYFEAMESAGYRVHDWNVDSGDSKRRGVPAAEIVANVKASRIADTLNVLLHDSAGHEESVKALPQIIQYYKALGYSFEVLEDGVKPMQFQLAEQIKWKRGKVPASEREKLAAFGKQLDAGGERRIASYREPALIVHRGEESLVLEAGEYSLIEGAIHVPLLSLTEWMGGEAELDEASGVIEASLMGKRMFWMSDTWPPAEGEDTLHVDVPLRATLSEFGLTIEDYVYTDERREVWIAE
nr:polysaccharide deacetylase family protein [Paenibacillus soyae]